VAKLFFSRRWLPVFFCWKLHAPTALMDRQAWRLGPRLRLRSEDVGPVKPPFVGSRAAYLGCLGTRKRIVAQRSGAARERSVFRRASIETVCSGWFKLQSDSQCATKAH
jgi:hypothetical protein